MVNNVRSILLKKQPLCSNLVSTSPNTARRSESSYKYTGRLNGPLLEKPGIKRIAFVVVLLLVELSISMVYTPAALIDERSSEIFPICLNILSFSFIIYYKIDWV
nr:MAG TPA: hypothetical protein [Bacteriophage sp.]